MRVCTVMLVIGWLAGHAGGAVAAEGLPTPEACLRHFAHDLPRQARCLNYAARGADAQGPHAAQWVEPLQHMHLLFGFFDRLFPGFNQGKEHMGVDLAAPAGTPVQAICDGSVVANRSNDPDIVAAVLIVEHACAQPLGRVYAYYGHIRSTLCPGEAVAAGEVMGHVRDWRGNSHLHLGLATTWVDEDWGVVPRGTTPADVASQGWLNPWDYFAPGAQAGGLKRIAPQAAVDRQHGAGDIAGQR